MTRAFLRLDGRTVATLALAVQRGIESAVGSFSAKLPLDPSFVPRAGMRAIVSIADDGPAENLLVGFVDVVSARVDARKGTVTIQGRDRTADIVDGARLDGPSRWTDASLAQIARDLVLPYGIAVVDFAGAERMVVKQHAVEPGESTFETLERAAEQFGLLLGTTPAGALALGLQRVGPASVSLRTGERGNVESWGWRTDHSKRFARLRVRGQSGNAGFGDLLGGTTERPEAIARDAGVRSQRELDVVAQGPVTGDSCDRLASWHVSVRRARSFALEASVLSWRQAPGEIAWRPGLRARVELPELEQEGDLLIASTRLEYSSDGERASLSLVRPDTLERDPTEGIGEEPQGFGNLL